MKLKRNFILNLKTKIILTLLFILIHTLLFINSYNSKITPRMLEILKINISNKNSDMITNSFNQQIIKDHSLNDIINIVKNKDDEIIAVNFDLEKAYLISINVAQNIKEDIGQFYSDDDLLNHTQEDGYILLVPFGIVSDNLYFANFGPKIPVKIKYAANLSTSIRTQVKDYGINNSLVEVYMKVILDEEILIPFTKEKITDESEILLASYIVEGTVPNLYNGLLEENSSLINVPLTS